MEELLASPLAIHTVLVSPALGQTERGRALRAALLNRPSSRAFETVECTDAELAGASDTDTPQGILAIAEPPERSFEDVTSIGTVLVLDGLQDPGNVGTILRTAQAFGVAATIALPGTVDLWNPKVVRSAMGALFSHVAFQASVERTLSFVGERSLPVWATSTHGEPLTRAAAGANVAIVVGNEANGVSAQIAAAASRTVAIPIAGVESLNVAVATGILLYALTTSRT